MKLKITPGRNLHWFMWDEVHKASITEIAQFIASDEFDKLTRVNQETMVKIYDQRRGPRRNMNLWTLGHALAGIGTVAALVTLGQVMASAETVRIWNCYDGDTCRTTQAESIRLACIDTPELSGPRAKPAEARAAREYLRSLLSWKEPEIRRLDTDRYGRTVAELYVDGKSVNKMMVDSGHAKIYRKYAYQCPWAIN